MPDLIGHLIIKHLLEILHLGYLFFCTIFANVIYVLYICDIKYMKKMEATIERTQTAFRLSNELLKRLKTEARKQNRSLNNFVESVLMDAVYRTPNAKTLAAVKEARENKNLETINLDNLEGFIESL